MPWIDHERCAGCGLCARRCPVDAITLAADQAMIDDRLCIRCGTCHEVCPVQAVRHDRERVPQLVQANREWVTGLLDHYRLPDERQRLLDRLDGHFALQCRVAEATTAWMKEEKDALVRLA